MNAVMAEEAKQLAAVGSMATATGICSAPWFMR